MAPSRLSLNGVCAGAALVYATCLLIVAARAPQLGFVSLPGSPVLAVDTASAAAGLRRGDLIVAVDGTDATGARARQRALTSVVPGETITLDLVRGGRHLTVHSATRRDLPLSAAAGVLLALGLLVVSFAAKHGLFQRITTLYVVMIAATMVPQVTLSTLLFSLPGLLCTSLAAAATCHHMLVFPAGRPPSRRVLALLYLPSLVQAAGVAVCLILFEAGRFDEAVYPAGRICFASWFVMGGAYLVAGTVARWLRMRRLRHQIDAGARRWILRGGVVMAVPMVVIASWHLLHDQSSMGGGYQPLLALTLAGGSACIFIAISYQRFGHLDRALGRGAAILLVAGVASAAVLSLLTLLGANDPSSGGVVLLGATVVAGLFLGPLGAKMQRTIDDRFSAEHGRARHRLRLAVEEASRTRALPALEAIVTRGVREALGARGCALYREREGVFRRSALDGAAELPDELGRGDELAPGLVRVPLPVDEPPRERGLHEPLPAALLVIATSEDRPFQEADRDLLAATAASLAVAFANASAHHALGRLSERLREEAHQSERRRRMIGRLMQRVEADKHQVEAQLPRVAGRAPVIGEGLRAAFDLVHRAAASDLPVMISGETGVGKELAARALHAGSSRKARPFVVVDCSAVSGGRFESILFGHERGAFEGAQRASRGAFRAADGGTLLLDEVGELPLELQAKLLRALDEKAVIPLGGDEPVPVDVRVVSSTRRDLEADVREGRFRPDLLYRLRVLAVAIPPLRARTADLPELAAGFLAAAAAEQRGAVSVLAHDALEALLAHDWPGNVRELQHVIEAAALTCQGDEIHAGDLRIARAVFRRQADRVVQAAGSEGAGLREALLSVERDRLVEVLRQHGGNQSAAARVLGLTRASLRRRLTRYGIG